MIEVLFLLLPVAAASGWWLARREKRSQAKGIGPTHPDFLRGLNYLLEEQPDKAIDTFLKLAEVDGETAETHLALGSLFRRRGEVDRAIRLHQNLVERRSLSPQLRGFALFELGRDYMCAGVLDRAEGLFLELVERGLHQERALQALRDIYQQERDWRKCLEVAEQLRACCGQAMTVEIAQYYCELAEDARRKGDDSGAQQQLALAQEADPNCVRAMMLEGFMALEQGDAVRAIDLFGRVAERGAAYVPEILPAMIEAMRHLGYDDILERLEALARRHASPPLMLSLSDLVANERGADAALDLLTAYLSRYADLAGLERLLELEARRTSCDSPRGQPVHIAHGVARQLLTRQPVYQCEKCGFQARTLHWHCPSCKCWGTVVPVLPEQIQAEPERSAEASRD
ncbi:lipopolysaccharide assembly protein LapB [Thiorhodococcus mannitoliphagus]|uniref:Lipopolysaccharide assembly protein B n=1 Tax=Thiorhodococcus mannitoliphagus TaxID=329406 RepID=A0A6P1DYQ7_9GAMM|nr:lipopolysaccharide assembly protein LapB [Thiorhodococcus mannitoliphagus]NEX23358.1 lipopolysaccharide assembly protein LapB [Thiorhodococcus mannitoliphagus]